MNKLLRSFFYTIIGISTAKLVRDVFLFTWDKASEIFGEENVFLFFLFFPLFLLIWYFVHSALELIDELNEDDSDEQILSSKTS